MFFYLTNLSVCFVLYPDRFLWFYIFQPLLILVILFLISKEKFFLELWSFFFSIFIYLFSHHLSLFEGSSPSSLKMPMSLWYFPRSLYSLIFWVTCFLFCLVLEVVLEYWLIPTCPFTFGRKGVGDSPCVACSLRISDFTTGPWVDHLLLMSTSKYQYLVVCEEGSFSLLPWG